MSGTKGMVHYSPRVKQEAIRLFLEEGYTYRQITEQLGIRKASQIEKWVRQYRKDGELIFSKFSGRPRKVENEKAYIARLEMENKLLKKLQSELRESMLAKRDIGRSTITKMNSQ